MDAVVAGHDIDGATIYVGRAFHEGDMIPAKVIPSKNVAYIPYNCEEIPKYDYQVRAENFPVDRKKKTNTNILCTQ